MSQALVSVVMPTYNHAAFIAASMRSVLEQSYGNIELIIIDNYSEDNTQQIIEGFGDSRILYEKFSNKGIIAASRNYGISKAKGKYVAFLDSDDLWSKDKLKCQVETLEQEQDFGLAFSSFRAQDSEGTCDGNILGPKNTHLRGYIYDQLLNSNFIVSSSAVVRKSVLDQVGGFDEAKELRCSEDFDLWLRIARKYKAVYVPAIQGIYRMHGANCNDGGARLQKALNVINKHLHQGWIDQERANRAKANFYFREGWFLIETDVNRARSYFIQALNLSFKNGRLCILCCIGLMFSMVPFIFRAMRKRDLDKRISKLIINPQNL